MFTNVSSQESPAHAGNDVPYNFTLNFRQDSPSASPYGYTVHLSEKKSLENEVNSTLIEGKTKGAAWWVSHCSTNSGRENYVKQLQVTFTIYLIFCNDIVIVNSTFLELYRS